MCLARLPFAYIWLLKCSGLQKVVARTQFVLRASGCVYRFPGLQPGRTRKGQKPKDSCPAVWPPASALRSLASVALSSAQARWSIAPLTGSRPLLSESIHNHLEALGSSPVQKASPIIRFDIGAVDIPPHSATSLRISSSIDFGSTARLIVIPKINASSSRFV
jgi:hypothetical protein